MCKNFLLPVLTLLGVLLLIGCSTNDIPIDHEMAIKTTHESEVISDEEAEAIESMGINLTGAELKPFFFPDGTSEERYLIEGDIAFTKEEYRELLDNAVDGVVSRQYSTYSLCYSPRTINVIGYTGGGGYGLSGNMRTGLQWAINNYNNAYIDLNFTLSFGTNYTPYDIVVYRVPNGMAGGVAGFPSGGNPYKWVQIFSGMDNFNTNLVEHLMTHEIGHCVGLRHTDWWNRASCGGGSNEGVTGYGAVYVPGTYTGIDWSSVMLACFNGSENGEFSYYDVTALRYLY